MSSLSAPLLWLLVGVMLSVSTIGVESPPPTPPSRDAFDPNAGLGGQAGTSPQPQFGEAVPPPSSDVTTYIEGELIRVSIPSNWRELPGSNAVTFAPEGAYGNAGIRSVFTHGLGIGLGRNDKRDLTETTTDFIDAYVLANPISRRPFPYRGVTVGDRPGLTTVLSGISEVTGEPERIEMFTTLLRDGTFLYVMTVVPRDCAGEYEATFRRIVASIEILDSDRRARD